MHLAYALLDGDFDTLIMVDAVPLGEPPGTVAVLEVDPGETGTSTVDAHGMTPTAVLGLLNALGGKVNRVFVVGCQPATLDHGMSLSEPVRAAVDEAAKCALRLAGDCVPTAMRAGVSPPGTRERR
jgi:hydrogenase maturation protease